MQSLNLTSAGALTLGIWFFACIAYLPRLVKGSRWVIAITLAGGFACYFGFEYFKPWPVAYFADMVPLIVGRVPGRGVESFGGV